MSDQSIAEELNRTAKARAEKLFQTLLYAAPETHQELISNALIDIALEWPIMRGFIENRTAGETANA